ncbi:MAG: DUF6807 family protein [Cyclobacteriaceae bacterium]
MSRINYIILIFAFNSGCQVTGQDLRAVKTADGIEISEGSSKILFYQVHPKSENGKYERTNYVHPLYSLSGNIITEDFPEDHPHHHGIFWSWHQILYNDKPIADGWMSENISWEVLKSDVTKQKNTITLTNEVLWKSVLNSNQKEGIVRENSTIIVHKANASYRLIDFDIKLAALKDNLKIGGSDDPKGYGGFSLRFKLPDDIRFLSRDKEVVAEELAVQAGPWLDFYGSFEGKNLPESGVAVFSHPSNPGHPQPWILRNQKSMQNPAFPGNVPVELSKAGLRFKYRLVIHGQNVNIKDIQKLYEEYARP